MVDRFQQFFGQFTLHYPRRNYEQLDEVRRDYIGDNLNQAVPERVLEVVGLGPDGDEAIRCETVLVETDYVDRAYSDAHRNFYDRLFRDIPRKCTRYHFFSVQVPPEAFTDPTERWRRRLQSNYLGFSVVYGLHPRIVGRTVVRPPENLRRLGTAVFIGLGEFQVHVAGYSLKATGFPFVQQDGRTAACASCALWMALSSLSRRFLRTACPSPARISDIATRFSLPQGHSFLDPGLNLVQMCLALDEIGYDHDPAALQEGFGSIGDLTRRFAKYVASGIPVVLCVELRAQYGDEGQIETSEPAQTHAITVSGLVYGGHPCEPRYGVRSKNHCTPDPASRPCPRDENAPPGQTRPVWSSDQWITGLIVHDDQSGPYRVMRFSQEWIVQCGESGPRRVLRSGQGDGSPSGDEPADVVGVFAGNRRTNTSRVGQVESVRVRSILVPLPPKVYLDPNRAELDALGSLLYFASTYGSDQHDNYANREWVLHTYLADMNHFKDVLVPKDVTPSEPGMNLTLPSDLVCFYRGLSCYRLAWITELVLKEDWNQSQPSLSQATGEAVLDSTLTENDFTYSIVHVPGTVGTYSVHACGGSIRYCSVHPISDGGIQKHLLLWPSVCSGAATL